MAQIINTGTQIVPSVRDKWRCWEMWRWYSILVLWWLNSLTWKGNSRRYWNIGWFGGVVSIRVVLIVSQILEDDLDGKLKHEEWFIVGRHTVYKERLFGVGGFPFLLSLYILLNTKVVLATVPFSDCFYYSCCNKTLNWPVRFRFLPNCSLIYVYQY